jgi:hypothetical protein
MINTLGQTSRNQLIINTLIVFLVLIVLSIYFRIGGNAWDGIIQSDGKGYYSYLPAIFTFHDLDFNYLWNPENHINGVQTWGYLYKIDGENVVKYPAGTAILISPFYLLGDFLSYIFKYERNGYSFFYQIMVSLAAISYTSIAFYYLQKLLLLFQSSVKFSLIFSITILFGTNLLNYCIYEPAMSHTYSFFASTLCCYFTRKLFCENQVKHLFFISIFIGLVIIIRPVNGIILCGLPILADNFNQINLTIKNILARKKQLFLSIIVGLFVLLIQLALWYLQIGKWFVYTYLNESFIWADPRIFKVLFSYKKGFFIYTPFMFLVIPAIVYQFIKLNWWKFLNAIIFFALTIYVISSWWCWYYGGSFGQRALIEFYPLYAIIILPFLLWIERKFNLKGLIIFCGIFVSINLIQSYQYARNIIHYDSMNYERYWKVFLKTSDNYRWIFYTNENSIPSKDIESRIIAKAFNEFEDCPEGWSNCQFVVFDDPLSGNQVCQLNELQPSSPQALILLSDSTTGNLNLLVQGWTLREDTSSNTKVIVELLNSKSEIEKFETSIRNKYNGKFKSNWCQFEISHIITKDAFDKKRITVYLLNNETKLSHFDDLAIFVFK